MNVKNKDGGLTAAEKKIAKGLLARGWRNQDIQALVNLGRAATVNSARITGVKQDRLQISASEKDIDKFIRVKNSYDPKTGLNPFYDERLLRSREAMLLAVSVFNNPTLSFKSEVFCILSNIAWTYMLHEFYLRKKVAILRKDGLTVALSEMLGWPDCPISAGIKANLEDIKELRDKVEHSLLEGSDKLWGSLFQANCLNFDNTICRLFGERLTLQGDLSFSLQFAKANIEQLQELGRHDIPPSISALNSEMQQKRSLEFKDNIEYKFSVVYSMVPASKSNAHFHFISPESTEGKEVSNILIKHKPADELYPYKPSAVVKLVGEKTRKKFTMPDHSLAWKKHKIRPDSFVLATEKTNRKYCLFHQAHKDWTYNDEWVNLLVSEIDSNGKN